MLPGDVVRVPQGLVLPCDFILLTGGVIVNEAMLTGESIPVMKACLPVTSEVYSDTETARHTLFGGTSVIQIRPVGKEDVKALVRSTGFMTSKGALTRDILYPKVLKFKFYRDSFKFVGIMGLIALIGFFISLPYMIKSKLGLTFIIDKSLNLVTITIPPALPAAMTCGTLFAINSLKVYNIFCISPQRINVAGRIKTFVFDKTGTLTEEGLSVLGFRTAVTDDYNQTKFAEFHNEAYTLNPPVAKWWQEKNASIHRNKKSTLFLEAMASTHAITYVDSKLVGDPLDVKMFQATNWVLEELHGKEDTTGHENVICYVHPENAKDSIYKSALIRRFDFTSSLMRMSVIC